MRRPTLFAGAALAVIAATTLTPAAATQPTAGSLATASANVTLPVGHDAFAPIAVSPDGRTAYVTAWGERGKPTYVNFVDVASGKSRQSAAVGKSTSLTGPALTPDGKRLAVGSWDDKAVSILDTRSGKVIKKIAVGGQPDTLFIGPKGSSLFAFLIDQGVVVKIDLKTYRVTGRFPTKAGGGGSCKKDWTGMNMTKDSKTLLLACSENGLLFMSTTNGRISGYDSQAGGGNPLFSPDRKLVYTGVANFFNITDARTGKSVATVNLWHKGDGDIDGIESPLSIAVVPNGSKVYATMPEVGQISVLDPKTGKETSRIAMDGKTMLNASSLTLSSDGTRVYAVTGDGTVITIDTATDSVVGTDPGPTPDPGIDHDTIVSSGAVLLFGSRIGQAWSSFKNDADTAAGFRILTMNGDTP
jgi:YVTN family beta-propeller protein